MKYVYSFLIAAITMFWQCSIAQVDCSNDRYRSQIFASSDLTSNIVYGQNINFQGNNEILDLDIYEPSGDTAALRPLIIMAHGGNFLGGDKTQGDVAPLCQDLAKRGYVTSSINYRVGMENFPAPGPDSIDAAEAVFRATHDARAAVRFFKKDAAENGNTWRIDTNLIFFGGSSAGGFMALHLVYLDQLSEIPTYIDTTLPEHGGGIAGNSGNPGYSFSVTAVINISGALGDTAWMKQGDTPVLSFHGDQDGVVPFGSDIIYLLGFYPLLEVDGSQSVHFQADYVGINNCFKPYWGADHTPHWGGHPNETQYYDTTLSYITNFLLQFVCNDPYYCAYFVGMEELNLVSFQGIKAFPNPAFEHVNIELGDIDDTVIAAYLYNHTGRLIRRYDYPGKEFVIQRGELNSGLYFLNASTSNNNYSGKIIFE